MALTEKEKEEILDTLKNTSMRGGRKMVFPEEAKEALKNCTVTSYKRTAGGREYGFDIIRPADLAEKALLHINVHGGGFIGPHRENDTLYAAWLAQKIKGIVVDINDYSTSDRAPWPAAHEQCYDLAKYIFENAEQLGADPRRISMGGYSAGGVLTAGVALRAADTGDFKLCLQVLGYPPLDEVVDPVYKNDSYDSAFPMSRLRAFSKLYFDGNRDFTRNPYASPVYATDEQLSKQPRTLVISAGTCNFRFEDEEYALRLASRGVEVTWKRFTECGHGFIPHFFTGWEEAGLLIARTIRSAVSA
jgi:acetyl esterase